MNQMKQRVIDAFEQQFKHHPMHIVSAPGRVNLIGEHTDYNDGFVFPAAINFGTWIAFSPRSDTAVSVLALDYDATATFEIGQYDRSEDTMWLNYVKGVTKAIEEAGFTARGVNMVISGNVPQGTGLSSSASLEIALTQVLCADKIDGKQAALIGQHAENEFVGCNCGIMDQLISALGQQKQALLIDCRSLDTTPVPLPDGYQLMIINSNVKRGLVDSEYNLRRQQCEQAAQHFGVAALRDVGLLQLMDAESELDPVVFKRALHVVSENKRVQMFHQALQQGNLTMAFDLMAESHRSMKVDFEITVEPIDVLVDFMSQQLKDDGGVRMTGGGFGGCVVALVPHERCDAISHSVVEHYKQVTGLDAEVFVCESVDGPYRP